MGKPVLCVDFDGVLHSYASGWQGADVIPDPPVDGAIAFLWDALDHFEVHVYSARSHQPGGIAAMRDWIARWDAAYWATQPGRPRTTLLLNLRFPDYKPPAQVTLDDRAITFTGTFPDPAALRAFRPWNKQAV